MCKCIEYVGVPIEPVFGICIANGNDVVGHHQHLFNRPWTDDIMYQYRHQGQPQQTEHVVRKDEIFIWEYPELLGIISLL